MASQVGNVQFFNMTSLTMDLTVNGASLNALEPKSTKASDYTPQNSGTEVTRTNAPNPFNTPEIGLSNKISWDYGLGGDKQEIAIDIDNSDYLINEDIQIYVYFKSAVVVMGSKAGFYASPDGKQVTA